MQQHDDHIWLTVDGGAWAIRKIERDEAGRPALLHLWRGYWPDLEYTCVEVSAVDWPRYCQHAVDVIEAQLRPLV